MARDVVLGLRKKLKDAAAYWVRGGHPHDAAHDDLVALGVALDAVDDRLGRREDAFYVWPEGWEAVQAFLAVQTQFVHGMGGPTGLDYTRVHNGLAMAGIACTPELFHQLRLLEAGVLDTLNAERKKS